MPNIQTVYVSDAPRQEACFAQGTRPRSGHDAPSDEPEFTKELLDLFRDDEIELEEFFGFTER